jgi:hypothetical protein
MVALEKRCYQESAATRKIVEMGRYNCSGCRAESASLIEELLDDNYDRLLIVALSVCQ